MILSCRYDQECVGLSTGEQLTIEFEHWLEDALAMVDKVCEGPVILVASSLGAWVRPSHIWILKKLLTFTSSLKASFWGLLELIRGNFFFVVVG